MTLRTTLATRLYPMGDRGGTATAALAASEENQLYPMGDRGGTATIDAHAWGLPHYTRWEIGGEPQLVGMQSRRGFHYTRWEIGGEPQLRPPALRSRTYYTRWEIGGEPQQRLAS